MTTAELELEPATETASEAIQEPKPAVEPNKSAKPAKPKVNKPHPFAGRMVFYWRVTNSTTGEISPLPAMLIEPTRLTQGWNLNFWRLNHMQGRQDVKFSEQPKAGCWTWGPEGKPKSK